MNDKTDAARKERKEEAKRAKRKRIEEAGGVRPRKENHLSPEDESQKAVPSPHSEPPKRTGFDKGIKPKRGQHQKTKRGPAIERYGSGRHRFGGVMEYVPCPNKSRYHTVSMAVPGSVVSNAQTRELRTQLVGQIARAAAIYHIDEIIVFDDLLSSNMNDRRSYYRRDNRPNRPDHFNKGDQKEGDDDNHEKKERQNGDDGGRERYQRSDPHTFMARVLQYLDCPQYLRRAFFPMHNDLQFAGLLPPLDAPHHVRAGEKSKYREGVVLDNVGNGPDAGSLVNCGIRSRPVEIDRVLAPGVRCTVQIDTKAYNGPGKIRGTVVSPTTPREEDGTYWGFTTRLAPSIKAVFDECPYEEGYDLKVGTSERGDVTVDDKKFSFPQFKHLLIVFGGVAGIEECIDADETMTLSGKEARKLFNLWVNTCPFQGSRTIRTEEAVLISLARFRPYISKNTIESKQPKVVKDEDLQFSDADDNLSEESSSEEEG